MSKETCAIDRATYKTVLSWNVMSLQSDFRVDEISRKFKNVVALLVQGTARRAWLSEQHHVQQAPFHTVVHFGWFRRPSVNKACGVAIFLHKACFPEKCISRIRPMEDAYLGRGGAVYVQCGVSLICFLSLYFPCRPQARREIKQWKKRLPT